MKFREHVDCGPEKSCLHLGSDLEHIFWIFYRTYGSLALVETDEKSEVKKITGQWRQFICCAVPAVLLGGNDAVPT